MRRLTWGSSKLLWDVAWGRSNSFKVVTFRVQSCDIFFFFFFFSWTLCSDQNITNQILATLLILYRSYSFQFIREILKKFASIFFFGWEFCSWHFIKISSTIFSSNLLICWAVVKSSVLILATYNKLSPRVPLPLNSVNWLGLRSVLSTSYQ